MCLQCVNIIINLYKFIRCNFATTTIGDYKAVCCVMFAAAQRNGIGRVALDTLWHYHEVYPSMDSGRQAPRNLEVPRVSSHDSQLPGKPGSENESESTEQPDHPDDAITSRIERIAKAEESSGELANQRALSTPTRDEDDQQLQQQQQQQPVVSFDGTDELDEVSLSLKQLVASFESMTSPYMRAPLIATRTN